MALSEALKKYNIRFKKSLGQNLLLDDNINRIMADAAALAPTDDVVEVGAGLGALTRRLAERAGRVLAVEIDPSFMPCLEDQFRDNPRVRLFRGDILNHDLPKLLAEFLPGGEVYKMVANLPYYITTPILFHFWESTIYFERFIVMVQEEVAQRLTAPVGAPNYGVLSIAARWYAEVDIVHDVPRTCFKPQPNVDSCIVRMRNRPGPPFPGVDSRDFMALVRAAFAQRRKTLRNVLGHSKVFGADRETILAALSAARIDPARRPQTLALEELATLTREIKSRL